MNNGESDKFLLHCLDSLKAGNWLQHLIKYWLCVEHQKQIPSGELHMWFSQFGATNQKSCPIDAVLSWLQIPNVAEKKEGGRSSSGN